MKYKILSVTNRNGMTLARSDTSHRILMAGGGWNSLNEVQKDAACRIVWSVTDGEFEIEERKAGEPGESVYSHRVA